MDDNSANQRLDRFCRKYFKPYSHITLKDIFHWIRTGAIRIQTKNTPPHREKEGYMLTHRDQIVLHPSISEQLVSKDETKFNSAVIDTIMRKAGRNWDNLILFEDENWLVRNKPTGIVAHEGTKHDGDITMNQLLEHYFTDEEKGNKGKKGSKSSSNGESTFKPAFAFRLDKDTTGVLVSAKTYPALQYINQIIRDHNISKTYLARVIGKPDLATIAKNYQYNYKFSILNSQGLDNNSKIENGELQNGELIIDEPLFKGFNATTGRAQTFVNPEKGLPSQTIISIQKTINDPWLGNISLLECRLLSGRMHQIRAHLAHIGYAVLGDMSYGSPVTCKLLKKHYHINRQLLHSYCYSFDDMDGKKIKVTAPIPDDFKKFD